MINFNKTNLVKNIQDILTAGEKLVKKAENGTNWEEVFTQLDDFENQLNQESSIQSHLNSVCFDEEFNQEYEKTLPLISDFYSSLGTNKKLYQAFKNLEKTTLNSKQQYILKNSLKDFELSGIDLEKEQKDGYKKLFSELSLLSNDFAKNSLQATNSYKKIVSEKDLKGLSENDLAKLKQGDDFVLSLQIPDYVAVITYCENRDLRQELYEAYVSRCSEFDEFNNAENMAQILAKRKKLAQLLGFENYSQYSLAKKMVKSPDDVLEFLDDLVEKSKPQAVSELKELNDFAGFELCAWDIAFYQEKLKQQKYGLSKNELSEYFPFTQVLKGLLDLITQMYSVEIKQINEKTYHPDIIVLEFVGVGKIYLDPFARKNKRGGAWMSDYQGLNKSQQPIAFVVCNGSSPTKNIPSLLEFDSVITLFHEFGHALHHLLTEVKYPSVAGISGVPWDGVELPSQYMEFFAYEKTVIAKISKHYKTGKNLPEEMFEKLIAAKNFGTGLAMLRQCEFALWDILTHSQDIDTYEILAQVRQKTQLLEINPKNRFLNTFGHIFAGGYASGYYSYKWAEVMAADAYSIVAKDKTKTNDFRKYILASGGESDFLENYIKFSGKKPDITALLKSSGIE